MSIPRIYADFNGLVYSFRTEGRMAVVLDTMGTLRELSNAGILLAEGFELVVYDWSDDEEDLEANAKTYFDASRNWWVAEFDDAGYQHVPKKHRDNSQQFLCWSCETNLTHTIAEKGLQLGARCPNCSEEIHRPIKAPGA